MRADDNKAFNPHKGMLGRAFAQKGPLDIGMGCPGAGEVTTVGGVQGRPGCGTQGSALLAMEAVGHRLDSLISHGSAKPGHSVILCHHSLWGQHGASQLSPAVTVPQSPGRPRHRVMSRASVVVAAPPTEHHGQTGLLLVAAVLPAAAPGPSPRPFQPS